MSKKIAVSVSSVLALLFGTPSFADETKSEAPVTRAAFDLGSGKFKVLVAEVKGKDIEVKLFKMISVGLGADLAENNAGKMSNKAQKVAMEALKQLKKDALEHGATEFSGAATAIFRKAENGEAFLKRLSEATGINLQIISQEKEGLLGFNHALALAPKVNEDNLVSWDIGSASFQIVGKEGGKYCVYEGPFGNSMTVKAFQEEVRNIPYTEASKHHPISTSEGDALIKVVKRKIALPEWLKNKLANPKTAVVVIGSTDYQFGAAPDRMGNTTYTLEQIGEMIKKMVDKPTHEVKHYVTINDPETVLIRTLYLYAVMEEFGMEKITLTKMMGSTLGLIIDKELWQGI